MTRGEVLLRKIELKHQHVQLIWDEIKALQDEYESIGDVAEKWLQKEATIRDYGNEEDSGIERLANLLHNSGLNGYSYPNNKSFPSWENYRKDIARGLIGRGINPKEATLKEYRDKEIELGF